VNLTLKNREDFINNFLAPVSKVVDSVILKIFPGKITSLIATSDNTIIAFAEYLDDSIDIERTLNIPDIKKLVKVLQCIGDSTAQLTLNSNSISYKDANTQFRYHLFADGIITSPKISIDKLKALEPDGRFTITRESIVNLIKGSTITADTNKIYLNMQDGEVYGELTDRSKPNTDSYGIKVSTDFQGVPFIKEYPINFEIIRIISALKFKELKVSLLSKMGVFLFELVSDNTHLVFAVSALQN